jgi:hypothetical protein
LNLSLRVIQVSIASNRLAPSHPSSRTAATPVGGSRRSNPRDVLSLATYFS